jgi:hypothetical protein
MRSADRAHAYIGAYARDAAGGRASIKGRRERSPASANYIGLDRQETPPRPPESQMKETQHTLNSLGLALGTVALLLLAPSLVNGLHCPLPTSEHCYFGASARWRWI